MAYNPPIGSIYHLYTTYSPCLLGGEKCYRPTTLYLQEPEKSIDQAWLEDKKNPLKSKFNSYCGRLVNNHRTSLLVVARVHNHPRFSHGNSKKIRCVTLAAPTFSRKLKMNISKNMGVSKNRDTPKRMIYKGKPY